MSQQNKYQKFSKAKAGQVACKKQVHGVLQGSNYSHSSTKCSIPLVCTTRTLN